MSLLDRLDQAPQDEDLIARARALPAVQRAELVRDLKSLLDGALRSSPDQALRLSHALFAVGRDLDEVAALAWRGRGAALHICGRTREAAEHYEHAARAHADRGEEVEEGRVLRSLVDVYQILGRREQALDAAQRARELFERHGETRLLAQLETNLGNVWFRLDDYAAARAAYLRARAGFEHLGDAAGLAFVDLNLANVETHAQEFEEAQASFQRAREGMQVLGHDVHVADCDYGLAYLLSRRGLFADALAALGTARDSYRRTGKPSGVSLCDKDVAETYLRLDAAEEALHHADRAARGFEQLELVYEHGQSLLLRAQALQRLARPEEALVDVRSAAGLFAALDNPVQAAFCLLQEAALELELGHAATTGRLEEACRRLARSDHHLLRQLAELTLARHELAQGRLEEARRRLLGLGGAGDRSLLDALVDGDRLRMLGEIEVRRDRVASALELLQEAVERIEASYANVPGRDTRIAYFRDRQGAYQSLARLHLRRHREGADEEALRQALVALERGRNRSSREGPRGTGDLDPEAEQRWRAARARVDLMLDRRLDSELGALAGRASGPAPSDAQLEEACLELQRLSSGTDRAHRHELDAAAEVETHLRPDEVLVSYLPLEEGHAAIVRAAGTWRAVELDAPAARIAWLTGRLERQLAKVRHGLAFLDRHQAQLEGSLERLLDELGERLIAPVLELAPEGTRALVVSPHGDLHALPWAALRSAGAPLLERLEVSVLHDLSHLGRPDARSGAADRQLWMAGAAEESLPAIDDELRGILRAFGPGARRDDQAVERLLREGSRPFPRAVHLAGHGLFHDRSPLLAGIRLQGGFLTASDLRRLSLPLDLVTFSGCDTGRRARIGGEDYLGLQDALFTAGTRAVVSTLWPVFDRDCASLMEVLYGNLGAGMEVRTALARAQRELALETGQVARWAAFSLSGCPHVRLVDPPPQR